MDVVSLMPAVSSVQAGRSFALSCELAQAVSAQFPSLKPFADAVATTATKWALSA